MASVIDISAALKRLTDTLPPPRGVSMDKAFDGYVSALHSFAAEEIDEAIGRYLAAEFPDVSLKFYPRAPELAQLVRTSRKTSATGKPVHRQDAPAPTRKTLFLRQWERLKAGEIQHICEGMHGAPIRRREDFGGLP